MNILSFVPDRRIEATNVLIELSIRDYINIAKNALHNNEYQRKKVIKSSIQQILRSDLLKGCTIPPIVLAVKSTVLPADFNFETFDVKDVVRKIVEEQQILILDGLQRTSVILDLKERIDNQESLSPDKRIPQNQIDTFLNQIIRAEIYVGVKKLGILYRMLTLNTGQTTMSTRHLMEILYYDFYNQKIEGIDLVADKEDIPIANTTSEFSFKDVLDGYYSFIEGSEVLLDRADILDNFNTIKQLEKTNEEKEGFKNFLVTYKNTLDKIIELAAGYEFSEEDFDTPELALSGPPFGKNALSIFRKSQALTGYGAALNFIMNNRTTIDFDHFFNAIPNLKIHDQSEEQNVFKLIIKHFDYIRSRSKKVGNDQRYYFKTFFQRLLDPEGDEYLKIDFAAAQAYKRVRERIEDQ